MADLEILPAPSTDERLADIEAAIAELLRQADPEAPAITYLAVSSDDLAMIAFALAALVALLVAYKLGGA